MKTKLANACALAALAWSALGACSTSAFADEKRVDFAREILPILSDKCFVCHGPDTKKKRLVRLDSYEGATRDLGDYRAIDPDSPEKSELIVRIHDADDPMPPKKSEKQLTAKEKELLTKWAKQGGKYAKHWAFVPPTKGTHSKEDASATKTSIDAFLRADLRRANVDFAPEADRATLARRVALILTGLPPAPDRLEAFLKDERPDAYERYVDELFSSVFYGEHQARYWLDAVRYGDTHGLHLDNRRGIFPYRDWVVSALNRNLPLDQFLTWQLAGDLLPGATLEQRVATGFVRMNPSTAEGGALPEEFQAKNNFDRTENLGTVLLGMSLNCARCHTHKYDPIPQTEYYRLLAFFNSTAEHSMDGNSYTYGPTVKAPQNLAAWNAWIENESAKRELIDSIPKLAKESKVPAVGYTSWIKTDPGKRWSELIKPDGAVKSLGLHAQADKIHKRRGELEKSFTTTLVAKDRDKPRETKLLRRGEYNLPTGDPLEPGILSVMGKFPEGAPRNRLGLAKWLTAREHPLVARVLVNRMWQRVFGEGLVRTPEDFGLQGEHPTHPELLDWLAVELHDSGWNLKHMLRLMVMTQAFRQSSAWRRDVDDPENRLWSRGPSHRLAAEEIRDLVLWASGLLDSEKGGEGVKPYQPAGLWRALAHPGSNTKQYKQDKGQKLYRRSLYVYWKRTSPHPMMTLFDAPNRESSCVRRSRTNTSLQSLGLFNEPQRVELSRAFAQRILVEKKDTHRRLDHLFTFLASRTPNDRERAACEKLLNVLTERYKKAPKDAEALLSIGEAPRDAKIDVAEHAAWTQVVITVLASDFALLLY